MKIIKHLDNVSRVLIISGILLMGYAEIVRILNIYFFWESQQLGGILLLASLISILCDYLIYKFKTHKYGFIIIKYILLPGIFLMAGTLTYSNKKSEPFKIAESYIYNSNELKNELGEFKIGAIPYITELRTHQIGNKLSGEARFGLILKGQNKYKDFEISLIKDFDDSQWRIK